VANSLKGFRVAVLATDGVQEAELTEPVKALEDAGAEVEVLSLETGKIQAMRTKDIEHGKKVEVDGLVADAAADAFDGVLLPGGAVNADTLRAEPAVQSFLKAMDEAGKPFAAICHAPWELISAGLVEGRKLTSYHTIQDDIRNAGGDWVDAEVARDGNWVTSRKPDDLPAFNAAMLELFAHARDEKSGARRGDRPAEEART
jgi:protease I